MACTPPCLYRNILIFKKLRFILQKAVFYSIKDGLLDAKTRPFARPKTVFCKRKGNRLMLKMICKLKIFLLVLCL